MVFSYSLLGQVSLDDVDPNGWQASGAIRTCWSTSWQRRHVCFYNVSSGHRAKYVSYQKSRSMESRRKPITGTFVASGKGLALVSRSSDCGCRNRRDHGGTETERDLERRIAMALGNRPHV